MIRAALVFTALLSVGCVGTGERDAVRAQASDVATTGIGLAMGAVEANPLGVATLGLKAIAYHQIKKAPSIEQPYLWSGYEAFGWGAAANNLCVIATIATGGAAVVACPVVGLATVFGSWSAGEDGRNRATFDAICADARMANPDLVCIYNTDTESEIRSTEKTK